MDHDLRGFIKKVPNFANTWHLVEIAHDDMNGNVPSWFVNNVYGDSCLKEAQTMYDGMKMQKSDANY